MQTTTLHLETFPFFNISLHLNQIKPISLLNVENSSDTDLQHLDITINSDVPFLAPFCHHIEVLPAQTIMEVPLVDLSVNRAFLAQLSETEQAQLSVLLKQGSEVLIGGGDGQSVSRVGVGHECQPCLDRKSVV